MLAVFRGAPVLRDIAPAGQHQHETVSAAAKTANAGGAVCVCKAQASTQKHTCAWTGRVRRETSSAAKGRLPADRAPALHFRTRPLNQIWSAGPGRGLAQSCSLLMLPRYCGRARGRRPPGGCRQSAAAGAVVGHWWPWRDSVCTRVYTCYKRVHGAWPPGGGKRPPMSTAQCARTPTGIRNPVNTGRKCLITN